MIISPGLIENVIAGSPKANGGSSVVSAEQAEGTFGTLMSGTGIVAGQPPVAPPQVEGEAAPVVEDTENSKQIKTLLNKLEGLVKVDASNPKSILTALLKLSAEITAKPMGQTGEIKTVSDLEKVLGTLPIANAEVDNAETEKMLTSLVSNLEAIFSHAVAMAEAMGSENIEDIKAKLTAISTELKEQVDQILQSEGEEVKVDLSKIKVILQEPPVDVKEPVRPQPEQAPVQKVKEPVQRDKEPVEVPVKPVQKTEVPVEQPAVQEKEAPVKPEAVEPKKIDLSENAEIKKALESLIAKVLNKIQSQNTDTQETKIDIIPADTENAESTENTELELQNIMEQLQVIIQPATQQTNNIEIKLTPEVQQTQLTQNEIKTVLNKVKALLTQQLTQAQQGTPMDMQKVSEQVKADLDGLLVNINSAIENKEVQITVPKLIKQLTEAIGEKIQDTPQPKKALNLDTQKVNTDIQLESKEVKEPVVHQSRKDPLSQLDRTLNVNKVVIGENKLTKPANQLLGRLAPDKDIVIERTLPEKIKDVKPVPDHNIDFTGKNAINSLFSKSNDPALAGVKMNTTSSITSGSLVNVASTAATAKPDSITNQVMEAVRNNFNKDQITVSLRPYNLGNVNVNVSLQKGALVAHMVTETTRAAESLKNGINSLRQVLAEAGLNVDKVIVTQAEQTHSANNNNQNESNKEHNLNNQPQDQQQQGASRGANLSDNGQSDNKSGDNSHVGGIDNNNTSTDNNTELASQSENNYIDTEKGLVNYRV